MENFGQNSGTEHVVSLEQKRNDAAKAILEKVETLLEEELKEKNYSLNGRERPIESYVDCLVAIAQAKLRSAERVHKEAIQEGDYRKEEFAAKFFELAQSEQNLAKQYAEMYSLYGENTEMLEEMTPGLRESVAVAKEMHAGIVAH